MKILQYGLPRSGTTMVNQVLLILFYERLQIVKFNKSIKFQKGDIKLFKTHKFYKMPGDGSPPNAIVGVFRDFRDVLVSNWRIGSNTNAKRQMTEIEVYQSFSIIQTIHELNMMRKQYPNMLWLKYEDYYKNIDYMIDRIINFFDIDIPNSLRITIKQSVNIDVNRFRASQFNSFTDYDKSTGIHGNHIFKGEYGGWKKFIPIHLHKTVDNFFRENLLSWGYQI